MKDTRIISGKSQIEISSALGYKNPQFISNVERGLCSIPLKKIKQVSKVMGIKVRLLADAMIYDAEATINRAAE